MDLLTGGNSRSLRWTVLAKDALRSYCIDSA